MRAEENNSDPVDPAPMVAAAASMSVIPDIDKMKKKKKIPKVIVYDVKVQLLDPWNVSFRKKHPDEVAKAARRDIPGMVRKRHRWTKEQYQIDPWRLRETRPDCVPVYVEKDARSDIPDVGMKKYLVSKDALLGDFVGCFRSWIGLSKKKPIFVFFKNTVPPTGAPMCAIDEENKDEDGFLHMAYSGEENFVWGASEEEQVNVESAAMSDNPDIDEKKCLDV